MEFKLLVRGSESLKKKFEDSVKQNPALHMDLIRSFGQTVMLALRLNQEDNISIDGFRAGEISEDKPVTKEEKEKFYKDVENAFFNESGNKDVAN